MSYRTEVGLVLLLAAALTLAILASRGRRRAVAFDAPASTYQSGPRGGRAPYDVLARLGVPVERRRTPLFDLARQVRRRPAVLVVVAPDRWLAPAEREAVARYVGTGGALVAAGDAGGLPACLGWEVDRPDSVDRVRLDSALVAAPPGLYRLPPVTRVLRLVEKDTVGGVTKRDAELRRLGRPGGRVLRELAACTAAVRVGADTLLATVGGAPVVVRLRFRGGGRALLVADDAYFRNAAWRSSDVPIVLVPLLAPSERGRVSWDEYHHGHGPGGSLARAALGWMARAPAGWVLWQLIAVGGVWLVVTAVRFGPPRPVLDRRRRSPLEHVEALAAGLAGAAGTETAVGLIVSGLRRRLSRAGQPSRGDYGQWLAALELALPGVRGRQAARRLRDFLTKPGGAERVLGAAQAVEDVWEELRPRAMPAASSMR
jgi:hypothetical protein